MITEAFLGAFMGAYLALTLFLITLVILFYQVKGRIVNKIKKEIFGGFA